MELFTSDYLLGKVYVNQNEYVNILQIVDGIYLIISIYHRNLHHHIVGNIRYFLFSNNKLKSLKVAQLKDDDGGGGVVVGFMNGCESDGVCV